MRQSARDARFAHQAGAGLLRLKILVLVCGAVLMSVEIVGSRIISPYFGSSIYVWGSLISVVMGALSLGYYVGGKLADRHPSLPLLGGIIVVTGVLLIALRYVSPLACEGVWKIGLGTRFGTLVTSMILFFTPGVLLGIVSPFSVRLAAHAVADVGKTAGVLYALSSVGSIAGTLVTAFVLIDFFGTSTIVMSLGIVLILTAVSCADLVVRRGIAGASALQAGGGSPHDRKADPEGRSQASPGQLRVIVVVCGASLMGLEIAAARIISPYFGHSIYVWGSLISVFLAALSLGYYFGGRLADRRPSLALLGSIIAAACIALLALRYVAPGVSAGVSEIGFGTKLGTLTTCVVLFSVPSVLLGVVSPFAVRLTTRAVSEVGATAGVLYALSTVGSIAGTLLASFLLIDFIGASATVLVLGAALIVVAMFAAGRFPRKGAVSVAAVIALVFLPISFFVHPPQPSGIIKEGFRIVYETDSAYQHIVVSEGSDEDRNNRPRRDLQFDCYTESAIFLDGIDEDDPDPDAATTYTDLMHLPLIFNPSVKTMLMIGGGGGTLPRQYRKHYGCDVDVVEIDPKVVAIAREQFFLEPDEKLRVHVEDGRMYLKLTDKKYDAILVDAFTGGGNIPFHLTTLEFLEEVKEHLSPGGVLAMNVINALDGRKGRLYRSILRTWRAAGLEQIYVFPKHATSVLLRTESHNLILVATISGERHSKREIEARALDLYQRGPVRVNDFVMHARNYLPDESRRALDGDRVLTDDYAPVELMVAE